MSLFAFVAFFVVPTVFIWLLAGTRTLVVCLGLVAAITVTGMLLPRVSHQQEVDECYVIRERTAEEIRKCLTVLHRYGDEATAKADQ